MSATIRVSAASVAALDHPANRPVDRSQRERAEAPKDFPQHMYVKVTTVDKTDKIVGEVIRDNMHVGTMMWLMKHVSWATTKGYMVEILTADQTEIDKYVADRTQQLAQRHQG